MLHRSRQKLIDGFTVVELIVIIVVIGILSGIVYGTYGVVTRDAFNARVMSDIAAYKNGFELYASQENEYPSVPRNGKYCLGTGGATGAELNTWGAPGAPFPATLSAQSVTEASYYCRDLFSTPTRHSNYPPLSRDLRSVVKLDQKGATNDYLVDEATGGVYVDYIGSASATSLKIFGWFKGKECPPQAQLEYTDSTDRKSICSITIRKTYPVNYTGASWPAAG